MTARPFMPLAVGDYLADTLHLSRSDHGAYMLLIMAYWAKGGPLPDDEVRLRRITLSSRFEWKKSRPILEKFFNIRDGLWHHKRIDIELEKIKQANGLAEKNPASRAGARAHGSIPSFQEGDGWGPPTAGELTVAGQEATPQTPGGLRGRAPAGEEERKKREAALVEEGAAIVGQPNLVRKMLRIVGYNRVAEALAKVLQRLAHLRSPAGYFLAICTGRGGSGPGAGRKPPAAEQSSGPPAWLMAMSAEELHAMGVGVRA